MALDVRIISNLDQTRLRLGARTVRSGHMLDVAAEAAATAALDIITPAVREETPVDTRALQESTAGDTIAMSHGQAMAQVSQPAESMPGVYYGQFVIHGHRIVAWGHDTGRMQPPNDYPLRAYEHVIPVLTGAVEEATTEAVSVMAL